MFVGEPIAAPILRPLVRAMLLSFIVFAVFFLLAVLAYAAPVVTLPQRVVLGSVPLALSLMIAWIAWKDV